jgi:mannose-6-phosphate isomerase
MDAAPGAQMIWGLRQGVDADVLRGAAEAGGSAVEQCIQRVPIAGGDFVYIPAGTVHATMAGMLLCEVQQSSNTTYRLWDWNRQPARPLHIDEACAVTNFAAAAQKPLVTKTNTLAPAQWHELVSNEFFTVSTAQWPAGRAHTVELANAHGLILCIPAGGGRLVMNGKTYDLQLGECWFLPAGLGEFELEPGPDGLRLILSESRELA